MSISAVRPRALVGAVAIVAVVAAGLLGSPSAALGIAAAVAADPVLFGLVVFGLYLVRPAVGLPPTALAALVGYGYGVALGVPIALAGVVTTVIPVFLAVRWLAGDAAADRPPSVDGRFGRLLERTGTVVGRYYESAGPLRGVVASRLAPIPSDVSTCAAAISGVGLRHLALGTAIGELPWTVAAVVVGASAATAKTEGLGELGATLTVGCLAAAAVLLAGPMYRVVRTRTTARAAGGSADG